MLSCGSTGKSLSSSYTFILTQIACSRASQRSGVSGAVLFHLGSWKPEAFPRTLVDRLRKNTSFQTSWNKKGWQEGIITLSEPGLWVGTVTFQKSRRLCCVMIGKRMEGRAPDIIDCKVSQWRQSPFLQGTQSPPCHFAACVSVGCRRAAGARAAGPSIECLVTERALLAGGGWIFSSWFCSEHCSFCPLDRQLWSMVGGLVWINI